MYYGHYRVCIMVIIEDPTVTVRAHVGGQFGRRCHLVKVDFDFSLVKIEVQVAL